MKILITAGKKVATRFIPTAVGSWAKGIWLVLLKDSSSSTATEGGASGREASSSTGTAGCIRQHLYSSDCICLG